MPGPFEVTPSTSTLTLDASRQATVTFTVKNTTKMRVRGTAVLQVTPTESQSWYALAPASAPDSAQPALTPITLDFAPEDSQSVIMTVKVPEDAALGEYRSKLVVSNEVNPDDEFTESSEVGFILKSIEKSTFPMWIIPVIVVVLIAVIAALFLLSRPGQLLNPFTPTPTATATATPTATFTPSATFTPTPTPLPTATPTPAFRVTNLSVGVNPSSTTSCPRTFTFTAVITGVGSGTITYRWERSDGASTSNQTLHFSGSSTPITTQWTIGGGLGARWERLHVISPNEVLSNQASFSVFCLVVAPISTSLPLAPR